MRTYLVLPTTIEKGRRGEEGTRFGRSAEHCQERTEKEDTTKKGEKR